jgi:hypothetical protein
MDPIISLRGLTYAELSRHRWYRGRIASVTRLGRHRNLMLHEIARNGSPLTVWVSCVAIEARGSVDWAGLLDMKPMPELAVHLRSRFVYCGGADRLTADIHYPENISVRRCNALAPC